MPGPPEPKNASVDKNKQNTAVADKAAADKAKDNNKKNDEKKTDSGKGDDDDGKDGGDEDKGSLDEKGNPFPMENKEEGGDPICPGGYKIDYQFDPINDPINPLFRCIPALKDPNDGVAGKLLAMANNPSGGVENLATGDIPAFGGKRRRGRKTKRRSRTRRSRTTRPSRKRHTRTRRTRRNR